MYKKKINKKDKFIIGGVGLIIIVLFVILNFVLPNNYKDFSKDGITFVTSLVNKPFVLLKNKYFINDSVPNDTEYQLIKDENAELKKQIDTLKKQLQINSILSDKKLINSTVINRNIEYWYDSFTIDKGSNDGIEIGMGVLYKGYLVGKISSVSYSSSTIRLLTSSNELNKLSIKISSNDHDIYGLLVGYEKGKYRVEGISDMNDIKEGSKVVTTGLGSLPSGIEIGKVSSVAKDNFDLANIVMVTPSIDMSNLDYVTVVAKK